MLIELAILLGYIADHVVPVPVNFPLPIEQPDIFWREKDEDSEWVGPYISCFAPPIFHNIKLFLDPFLTHFLT